MAYRFNGTTDYVEFDVAPLSGYSFGPLTYAMFLKRARTGVTEAFLCLRDSGDTTNKLFWRASSSTDAAELGVGGTTSDTNALSSTSTWYLAVVTRASGGSTTPRFHLHDGTSWAHASPSGAAGTVSVVSTDRLRVARQRSTQSPLSADIVCVGVKKADSSDATVETLSRTLFSAWTGFGFDWLIGFDTSLQAAGVLQDQASPGTGDQVAISGTSVVSDPPGWAWTGGGGPAFVPQITIL